MRWIFEALARGDLSGINPEWFASKTSEDPADQLPAVTKELELVAAALLKKNTILVGHNLFYDLGFLYKTFVGPLPASLKEFQQEIHALFPIVIDTKYLATHEHDDMSTRASLKDLLEPFRNEHMPRILLHEQHSSYGGAYSKEHEAGYDSWLTAQLFVKLSGKLWSTFPPEEFFSAPSSLRNFNADSDVVAAGVVLVKSRTRTPPHGAEAGSVYASTDTFKENTKVVRTAETPSGFDATDTLLPKTTMEAAIQQGLEATQAGEAAIQQLGSRLDTPYSSPSKDSTAGGVPLFTPKAGSKAIPIMRPHPEPSDSIMDSDIDMDGGAPLHSPTPKLPQGSRHARRQAASSTVGPVNTRPHAIPIHRPDPEPASEPALSTDNMMNPTTSYESDNDTDTTPSPTKFTTLLVNRLNNDALQSLTNRTSLPAMQELPSSFHATQLTPTTTIQHDNNSEDAVAAPQPAIQQWLPDLHDDYFWELFVNKLRVNAVEGGVIDLAQ